MSRPVDGKPVQLVRIDDNGRCHVHDAAATILGQFNSRLAVVGVVGLYRTGKSFLLNRLLGQQSGFEIGPSVNPCTKGLWMWSTPVELTPGCPCLLIDSEGLGSAARTASCDMQIFSLCLLLSSCLVYNSIGAIDEQALDDLNLVLHLAEHIHVRSGTTTNGAKDLSQHLPALIWVLRDFFLRLVDGNGQPITGNQYLENALQSVPGNEDKNKVRNVIKDLFPQRDCITLARPVADEAELRVVQQLPYDSLRPQFRSQVEVFIQKVSATVKPKELCGTPVTGPTFLSLATEYCKAINNSAVPTIQSAWTSAVKHQLRLGRRDAMQAYSIQMEQQASGRLLPMGEQQLQDIHDAALAKAMAALTVTGLDQDDPNFQECVAELRHHAMRSYELAKADNLDASTKACERIAAELFETRIRGKLEARGSYRSVQELVQDWAQVRKAYMQQTTGPAQLEVLSSWVFQKMTETVQRLGEQLRSDAEVHCTAIEQKFGEAEDKWRAERAELEQQLHEARRQLAAPSMPPQVADAMASHVWRHARCFVCRAALGLPCRVIDHKSGLAVPSRCKLDTQQDLLLLEQLQQAAHVSAGAMSVARRSFELRRMRNMWVCADSEIASVAFGALQRGQANPDRVLVVDAPPAQSIGIVMHSAQAREMVLDGVAVLVAVRRARQQLGAAQQGHSPGGLRPPGLSLRSSHLTDPICAWLAQKGGGEAQLMLAPESCADSEAALDEAADALDMSDVWHASC